MPRSLRLANDQEPAVVGPETIMDIVLVALSKFDQAQRDELLGNLASLLDETANQGESSASDQPASTPGAHRPRAAMDARLAAKRNREHEKFLRRFPELKNVKPW
jgi:hypothetical protein